VTEADAPAEPGSSTRLNINGKAVINGSFLKIED